MRTRNKQKNLHWKEVGSVRRTCLRRCPNRRIVETLPLRHQLPTEKMRDEKEDEVEIGHEEEWRRSNGIVTWKKKIQPEIGDCTQCNRWRVGRKIECVQICTPTPIITKIPISSYYRQKYSGVLLTNANLIYFLFSFSYYTTNSIIFKLFITIGPNSNHI